VKTLPEIYQFVFTSDFGYLEQWAALDEKNRDSIAETSSI
jgi:hypothetical protein